MAQERPNVCAVCHQQAFGYNYDVVSCNACKMFFRRSCVEKIDESCRKAGKCFDGNDLLDRRPRCRPCRFNKCVRLGMRRRRSESEEETLKTVTSCSSSRLAVPQTVVTAAHVDSRCLQNLYTLHVTRRSVYSVINILEDPSFCDLVAQGSRLGTYARPQEIKWERTERKLKPWGSLGVLLVVEVCKTLDVYNELLLSDRVLLLKNTAFKSHHLSIAFDSYHRKKGRVFTPQDDEMFPPVLFTIPECEKIIMELLTSPVQPLIENNLTENEYLLLNMIVICNPGIRGLSPGGQATISEHQRRYARLLFQQCMLSDPKIGPSRFAAILSINQKLDRQIYITQKMDHLLRLHWDSTYYFPKIMLEACRMDRLKVEKEELKSRVSEEIPTKCVFSLYNN